MEGLGNQLPGAILENENYVPSQKPLLRLYTVFNGAVLCCAVRRSLGHRLFWAVLDCFTWPGDAPSAAFPLALGGQAFLYSLVIVLRGQIPPVY